MAITYIVGNPGSGKTYYAVNMIYEYFVEPFLPEKKILGLKFKRKIKNFNYSCCYSNINGLKFEISDKLIPFDFDKFYLDLNVLFDFYHSGACDDDLNSRAKELKLFNALFIIDEAHNILKNKDDKVLVWWLTYHRHMFQEIIFITQDLSLISNEYKRVAEFFFKALNSTNRFSKNSLRYVQFSSYKLFQKDIISRFSLRLKKEVFELYKSGDNKNFNLFFKKIMIFFTISLIILFSVFYYFMSIFSVKSDKNLSIENKVNTSENLNTFSNKNDNLQDNVFSNLKLFNNDDNLSLKSEKIDINSNIFKITCVDVICRINDKDENSYIDFPKDYFLKLLDDYPPIYHFKQKIYKGNEHFIVFDKNVFENLKKGVKKNEKDTNNSLSLF